ncbi:GNAT family N-acetyltransferase [Streptomyces sp. NPDC085946]|uniref:GNAT family N-acetyltransferase n=1 Tax=Streptomyces sp. NPDC085946 TaxID=3365744 RepID=UPI0037D0141F
MAAARDDLLDRVAGRGPTGGTPAGVFPLVPVRPVRDLARIARCMNAPAVAASWQPSGPQDTTEQHVRARLAGDGRGVPCVGVPDATPVSHGEIHRADLDPPARRCPVRPHDTGRHLLIGAAAHRGRGLGGALLGAVAGPALDRRPACARVVAEPGLRDVPSVAAFPAAGFRFSAGTGAARRAGRPGGPGPVAPRGAVTVRVTSLSRRARRPAEPPPPQEPFVVITSPAPAVIARLSVLGRRVVAL